jgi:hypothetical protein
VQNRTRLGFGRDRAFVPTPNVRNPNMLTEAEAFSHHLGNFESAVRDYHKRVQGEPPLLLLFLLSSYECIANALGGLRCQPPPGELSRCREGLAQEGAG